VERPDFVDDGRKAALGDEFEESAEFVLVAHVGAHDRELAREEKAEVELGVVPGGGAAGDEAATVRKAFYAVIPGGRADVLEYDVHAMIVGQAADFLGDWHDPVVNHFVGANLLGFLELFVAARSGNHMSAEKFCDLDGRAADAAARREDQHGFARLQLSASDEHVPGSLKNERDCGGVDPIQIFGIGHAIDVGAADVFGAATVNHVAEVGVVAAKVIVAGKAGRTFAAGDAGSKQNFLADVDGVDFRADFGHFAGDVAAGNVRKWDGNAGEAATDPEVEMVEGAGMDADEDVVVAELGFVDVGVMENAGITVLVEENGFHGGLSRRASIVVQRSRPANIS